MSQLVLKAYAQPYHLLFSQHGPLLLFCTNVLLHGSCCNR